jgi:hypothetical protein
MRKLAIFAIAAASLVTTSAFAQGVGITVGPRGPGVVVDDGYRGDGYRRDREYRRSRAEFREERRYRRDRDWDRPRRERVYIERD